MVRYLVRFDDLCPTMARAKWSQIEAMMNKYDLEPIVAIIPDNKFPKFFLEEEDPNFWARMRNLQERQWTIALHGFQHIVERRDEGLRPIGDKTEFAGLPEDIQREKIGRALEIFQAYGLKPQMWVAPWHTFDRTTLSVLRSAGITCLSDGLSLFPFREDGMLWIPQQIYRFKKKLHGVWTVCFHPNQMDESDITRMEPFIAKNRHLFTSVPEVARRFSNRTKSLTDKVFEEYFRLRLVLHIRRVRKLGAEGMGS